MNLKSASIILLASRILLGLTFAFSAIGKILNSDDAAYLVELMAYELFWVIEFKSEIVAIITGIELVLAILLLLGKSVVKTLVASLILIAGLSGVLFYIWLQGFSIESCGCFGSFDFLKGFTGTFIKNGILTLIILAGLTASYLDNKSDRLASVS